MTLGTSKLVSILFLGAISASISGQAQIALKAHVGLGYIEHFSAGITCSFAQKHNVSLLFGSNFFTGMKDFHTFMLQYDRMFVKLGSERFIPRLGIKGGDAVYTSDYYRWKVVAIIPFAGINYKVNEKAQFFFEAGPCFSLEQTVTRIRYGELETYREWLPEIKTGFLFQL